MPGWLPSAWGYRKSLYINGSSAGSQIDYQMKITVNYGAGVDGAGNVFCGGNCRPDFADMRLTDSNNVPLSYWIESYIAGQSATVWVKIPSIPVGANSVYIYLYYGNLAAGSLSNIDTTFIFGDDFRGGVLNASKWTKVDASGYITIGNELLLNGGPGTWGALGFYSVQNFNRSPNILAQVKYRSDLNAPGAGYSDTTMLVWKDTTAGVNYTNQTYGLYFSASTTVSGALQIYEDGVYRGQPATFNAKTQYWVREILKASGCIYQVSTDELIWTTLYDSAYSSAAQLKLGLCHYGGGLVHVDNIIVRNYVSPEPAWSSTLSTSQVSQSFDYWVNRKGVVLSGASSQQTNYQVPVVVHKGTGTDGTPNSNDVYVGTNVRNDFGDLRFTKSDGTSLLNYWIESYVSGVSAIVWVQVDTIAANPSTTKVYVYYNNQAETSLSNGPATMEYFDSFETDGAGDPPPGWTGSTGQYTVREDVRYEGGRSLKGTASYGDYSNYYNYSNYANYGNCSPCWDM